MGKLNTNKKKLSTERRDELFRLLKARFEKNRNRHKGLNGPVQAKLESGWRRKNMVA
jgi:hypothetical protein